MLLSSASRACDKPETKKEGDFKGGKQTFMGVEIGVRETFRFSQGMRGCFVAAANKLMNWDF